MCCNDSKAGKRGEEGRWGKGEENELAFCWKEDSGFCGGLGGEDDDD